MGKHSKSDKAYELLKQAIINNEFAPGAKLSIADLSKQFDVGNSPLREALARLTAVGLIECQAMKGYRIPDVSLENMKDLYRARLHLDNYILRLVTENITDDDEAQLIAAHHQLKKIELRELSKTGFMDWQAIHKNFLTVLMSACHSPALLRLHRIIYMQTVRYRNLWYQWSAKRGHKVMKQHAADHQAMVDAVIARDAEQLIQAHERKIYRWMDEMRECLPQLLADGSA